MAVGGKLLYTQEAAGGDIGEWMTAGKGSAGQLADRIRDVVNYSGNGNPKMEHKCNTSILSM